MRFVLVFILVFLGLRLLRQLLAVSFKPGQHKERNRHVAEDLVEDPVTKVMFPKSLAIHYRARDGKDLYFSSEETKTTYLQNEASS